MINSLLLTSLLIHYSSALNVNKCPQCATFHNSCLLFLLIKILKEADTVIHQPASPRPSWPSCPELAENPPDDWVFITALRRKQVPLWFLSWCSSLVQKELVGNTPQTDLFSLKLSFSVVPPRSRQQLSFGNIETTSEFLLHCTHRLSAFASNFFPWLQTQRLFFPLQWEVKEHLLAHGCLLHCRACLHTALAHRAGSVLGAHQVHIWLGCPLSGSQIRCGQRHRVLQGCPGALTGCRWLGEMRIANYVLLPGTIAWESCGV